MAVERERDQTNLHHARFDALRALSAVSAHTETNCITLRWLARVFSTAAVEATPAVEVCRRTCTLPSF